MAKRSILIVAVDGHDRNNLERMVTGLGFEVAGIASSEGEAAAFLNLKQLNSMLVDIGIRGDAGGIAAAEAMRRRWSIPIVVLLTGSEEATLRRAKMVDPFGYLEKPFSERELYRTLEMALYRDDPANRVDELEEKFFVVSIDLLCCLDYSGYFRRLNPAWEKALGFTLEELKSKPFIEFVHPDDRERTLRQNGEVRAGGQALSFENRYLCKDGSYRWLRWNAAPDSGGKVIYSVARDITDQKNADEEREELVAQLQAALAEVKTLREILPICSYCRNVRDDGDYWQSVEAYITRHTSTKFSHGICPACYESVVEPLLSEMKQK